MMALAIRLDHLIKSGQVTDQAELARVGHVSRARLSQILDLNLLAPKIQESVLSGSAPPLLEKELHAIVRNYCWEQQNRVWIQLCQTKSGRDMNAAN
jgi:hypothetical protein